MAATTKVASKHVVWVSQYVHQYLSLLRRRGSREDVTVERLALHRRQLTLALVLLWRPLMEDALLAGMMSYSLSPIHCWRRRASLMGMLVNGRDMWNH
jgi:hypothetical protein